MKQRKICMIGGFAVGKTSLVSRFVHQRFSKNYLTTVGVRIDRKQVEVDSEPVNLMLWDLHGDDAFQTVQMSYLRGLHGYILVVDGTRLSTLEQAYKLEERIRLAYGEVPRVCAINKSDLESSWEVTPKHEEELTALGIAVRRTSAADDSGVEPLFEDLAASLA